MEIAFGDNVRVIVTPETAAMGLASEAGQVLGFTTPSSTFVEVIGDLAEDYAINVSFEEIEGEFWFSKNLLEFIDHGAGTEMIIGDLKSVRRADGTWDEARVSQKAKKK